MKPSTIIVACLTGFAVAKPFAKEPHYDENGVTYNYSPLKERGVDLCSKVNLIVKILKLNKATPFCSSFLSIQTKTVTQSPTITNTAQVTNTLTDTITTTITDRTLTESFTETKTVATVPTVVATVVSTSSRFSTVTITPPPIATVTTTIYTTPAAKRSAAVVEERGIRLPPFLAGQASSAVSQACSCLSIATPTVTVTSTVTASATSYATVTDTLVATSLVTDSTSVTETSFVTSYDPTSTVTTFITTFTSTQTLPAPTATATVYRAIRPECRNIVSGNKLYTQGAPGRNIQSSSGPSYTLDRSETGWSTCCMLCYDTPNCNVFFNSLSTGGTSRCSFYVTTGQLTTGVSAQCPNGVATNAVASFPGQTGFGLGPCWDI